MLAVFSWTITITHTSRYLTYVIFATSAILRSKIYKKKFITIIPEFDMDVCAKFHGFRFCADLFCDADENFNTALTVHENSDLRESIQL